MTMLDRLPTADAVCAPRRIAVIGNTGSGKSTLAGALARCLGVPHVELDAFMHEANWTPADPEVFRARVAQAAAGDGWVTDGNYGQARDLIWPRAELIVWLDYGLPRVFARLFRRTLRRTLAGVELWNGNRERFWTQFFTRESLFLWAVKTHGRRRREYPALFHQPEYREITVARMRHPRETRRFLAQLCAAAPASTGAEPWPDDSSNRNGAVT